MRKITALCLSLALVLLCGMPTAMADEGMSADTPELPQVTVTGVNVTNTEYFELGVKVKTTSFQSVGLVLAYDTRVLQAATWTDGSEVAITGNSWDSPTVLMTKGADQLSGKPALAYRPAEESDPYAYVYLGANALKYTDLDEKEDGEQVVTLRFQRLKNNDETLKTVTMGASEDHTNTVELAPVAIAEDSIAGYQAIVSLNADTFYTQGPSEDPTTAWGVTFGEVTTGPGIGTTTTTSGGGGYAITFFDWDGRVIDAVSAEPDTAASVVAAWETDNAARLSNKPGYQFDCWLVVEEHNDGAGLVTKHDTFTSNDEPLPAGNQDVADLSNLFPDETKTSVFLQAAYYAKTTGNGFSSDLVNGGRTDNTDRYYTISEPVYTRYGGADATAGSYSLTMTVTRLQENGTTGVTRLREPAIYVAMTPASGGANILNMIRLENTDETTFEVVTTKQISTVTYKVIDVYGIANWPGCADRSDVTKGSRNRNTCITLGTQGYLAEQAYNVAINGGTWEATVNNWAFADCFYNNGAQSGKAAATWWTEARCNSAKTRLLSATTSKGAKLTYAEVLTAVNGVS